MLQREFDCLIGLGSNVGCKAEYIHKAVEGMSRCGKIEHISPLYQTQPWGNEDQDYFVNAVLCIQTSMSPWTLLKELELIENQIGKEKKEHWGPRRIDLDILYFGQKIIFEKSLIIPHPFLHLRNFVLVPMREIAAEYLHPVLKKTTTELLNACSDTSRVELYPSKNEYAGNDMNLF